MHYVLLNHIYNLNMIQNSITIIMLYIPVINSKFITIPKYSVCFFMFK